MTTLRPGPPRARPTPLLARLHSPLPALLTCVLTPLLIVTLLTTLLAVTPLTPTAHAAEPEASVTEVTLSTAELTDASLTLSGSITNTGTEPLHDVAIALWRSTAEVRSATAVEEALAATATPAGTARVVEPANRLLVTTEPDQLAPGASRPFTVSGSLAALGLTRTDTSWWVGVDASGRTADTGRRGLGSARTLVTHTSEPLRVATVVGFSAPPRHLKQDLFLDEGLVADVTTGRLAALMTLVETQRTSWVVDPALLAELRDMADGYRVQTESGSTVGEGAAAASAWLDRLAALPAERGAVELFGSPDLSAIARAGAADVTAAIARASTENAPEGLLGIAVLDQPDAPAYDLAAQLGRPVLALDADSARTRVTTGETEVVVAHPSEHAPPAPTSPLLAASPLTERAALLARTRVAGASVRWVREPADLTLPAPALPTGMVDATLAELLELTGSTWSAPSPDDDPSDAQVLEPALLARLGALRARMTEYGAAAPEAGVAAFVVPQTARAASRWWVGHADQQDAWLAGIERRVASGAAHLVNLDAAARFSMTGATSEFPVTVTNHLTDPVTVKVSAVTDTPQRIRLTAPDPVTIAPGASNTVLLLADSGGSGVVRASVHVETLDGHRLTPDREIVVETTNYGAIGWLLVVVSGVVLVATTAHRIRQVRGRRKGEDG